MTLRSDRHRAAVRDARRLARSFKCPDCLAEITVEDLGPGVVVANVVHDETCPSFLTMRSGQAP